MNQQTLLRSIVRIHAYGRPVDVSKPFLKTDRTKGVGTGAFVTPPPTASANHLFVITCSHCVDTADTITVMLPFRGMTEHPATVVSILPAYDLAVVAIPDPDAALRPEINMLPLGNSATLQLGEKLTAVGYPLGGTALKASDGVYAGFQEKLQHTVSISPGNSGGPLMNEAGAIVGINNSGILSHEASNVGFAIPIEHYIMMMGPLFIPSPTGPPAPDRVVHLPMFGFEYVPITRSHATAVGASGCLSGEAGGVQIITVFPGSPMATAGVAPNDILLAFNNLPIDVIGDVEVDWNFQKVRLHDVLHRSVDGVNIPLRIWRATTQECATVTVTPQVFMPGALRMLYPPYDPVPHFIVVGLVIMPLVRNHAMCPPIMRAYLNKKSVELANNYLIISHVINGTLAQIEGPLVAGDEITHVNNQEVHTLHEVQAALLKPYIMANYTVLSFRSPIGKTLVVNVRDAHLNEQRAVSEQLYKPNPELLTMLTSEVGRTT